MTESTNAPFNAPLTSGIHHLGLTVADLTAAKDFFLKALHFKLLGENLNYPAAFVTDGTTMITLWAADADATPFDRKKQVGLHHAAFTVGSLQQLSDLYDRLKDWAGVQIEGEISAPSTGSPARHFLVRMPGGPRIEFFVAAS